MSQQSDLLQLALLIRRGQFRIGDVSPEQRPGVLAILHSLTDAQEATLAHRQEAPRKWLGRSRVFQRASS